MPKNKRSAVLDTKTKRLGLAIGKEHPEPLDNGCYLIYYRSAVEQAGSWRGRWYNPETRKKLRTVFGTADDYNPADGIKFLEYKDAKAAAEKWFKKCGKRANQEADGEELPEGKWTVNDALTYYFTDAKKTRKKAANAESDEAKANVNTRPVLGPIFVEKLTTTRIKKWHWDLADRGRVKTGWGVGGSGEVTILAAPSTPEEKRRRKVSANKELARFKAAMNFCVEEGKLDPDHTPWALVKAFGKVNKSRVRFLSVEEQTLLINACSPGFRPFVIGALITGARYSELAATRVSDLTLEPGKGALSVNGENTKTSKSRSIWLTEEGEEFFRRLVAGKASTDLVFTHAEAEPVRRIGPRFRVAFLGTTVTLSSNEVKILEILVKNNGAGVRYETLQAMWPQDPHRRRRVTGTIAQLKAKLVWVKATFQGTRWAITFTMAEPQLLEFLGPTPNRRAAFEEDDGWRADDAKYPLAKALDKAEIEALTFHELRHSYASDLVNRGVPLIVVARQLGHSDTQMVEKHYGHLCKTAEQRMIREGGKVLGLLESVPKIQPFQVPGGNPLRRKVLTPDFEEITPFTMNPIQKRVFTADSVVITPVPASLIRGSKKSS